VRFIKHGPRFLVWLFVKIVRYVMFNRVVLWFGGGVPGKQYELIKKDGVPIENYIARTIDGEWSQLRTTLLAPLMVSGPYLRICIARACMPLACQTPLTLPTSPLCAPPG
jgi:hypothetical protein